MSTEKMVLFLFLMLFQGTPSMRVLDRGAQSNVDTARQAVARTAGEWTALWREHAPDRAQPAVDFAREMVVGVFMGTRPTAGFNVEILGAAQRNGIFVVEYRETRPSSDTITAQVLTSPYHIVALLRVAGDVRFERVQ
jgi:protease stability complex PrcB-like protein